MLEIFTAAFPVFVTTTFCPELLPTAIVPNATLVGDAVNWPVAVEVPEPDNATVSVGFVGSLLVIVTLPVLDPAAVGVNVIARVADCPAAIVLGVVIPLIANSVPASVRTEIVRSAEPVFDNARLLVPFCPIETFPKSTEGFTDNCGVLLDAVTAEADKSTTTGFATLSPETVSVPVTFPAAVAVTPTLNFADCPAGNANGMASPLTVNWGFDTCAAVMFAVPVPEFNTDTDCVVALPTVTFPKLRLPGVN